MQYPNPPANRPLIRFGVFLFAICLFFVGATTAARKVIKADQPFNPPAVQKGAELKTNPSSNSLLIPVTLQINNGKQPLANTVVTLRIKCPVNDQSCSADHEIGYRTDKNGQITTDAALIRQEPFIGAKGYKTDRHFLINPTNNNELTLLNAPANIKKQYDLVKDGSAKAGIPIFLAEYDR